MDDGVIDDDVVGDEEMLGELSGGLVGIVDAAALGPTSDPEPPQAARRARPVTRTATRIQM